MPWHFDYNRLAGTGAVPDLTSTPQGCLNCGGELPPKNLLFCSRACQNKHGAKLAKAQRTTGGVSAERRRGMETLTHGNLARGGGGGGDGFTV